MGCPSTGGRILAKLRAAAPRPRAGRAQGSGECHPAAGARLAQPPSTLSAPVVPSLVQPRLTPPAFVWGHRNRRSCPKNHPSPGHFLTRGVRSERRDAGESRGERAQSNGRVMCPVRMLPAGLPSSGGLQLSSGTAGTGAWAGDTAAHAIPGSMAMPRAELCPGAPMGLRAQGRAATPGRWQPTAAPGVPAIPALPQPRGLLWPRSPLPLRGCCFIN